MMELNLDKRLEELTKQKDQVLAQLNATIGAVEVVKQLIAERDKPEPEAKEAVNG
jgi:hypothetical protein